ncbi:MAG: outer membrane beta-barrel protein [Pelagibacterales bacterium]|nr:outer membrane beta-barrel protein [Pelagibacterales bacterium]
MKKYIIIIIVFLAFSLNTYAQSFGLKGGVAVTNFIGSDANDLDAESRTGFFLGAFTKLGEGNIEWMPEVLFHQKGAKEDGGNGSLVGNYIDIGANGLFHINDELALAIGPYLGYAVSGTLDGESITDWDGTNRVEFGSNLGAIYNINDLLHLDVRYGMAFTDMLDDVSIRNSSFQIGVGYVFGY